MSLHATHGTLYGRLQPLQLGHAFLLPLHLALELQATFLFFCLQPFELPIALFLFLSHALFDGSRQ
ncbi:MAG: hypothetical protein IPO99_15710 [Nitrospira sp.]|nr:hypothetical protein [Nitrospira sp.]